KLFRQPFVRPAGGVVVTVGTPFVPTSIPAVMARRSGQGMKPLAARAYARPLTAPSTMTLLDSLIAPGAPSTAGSTVLMERARSRSAAGYRPATLPLDSLVGSLAARPIASLLVPPV